MILRMSGLLIRIVDGFSCGAGEFLDAYGVGVCLTFCCPRGACLFVFLWRGLSLSWLPARRLLSGCLWRWPLLELVACGGGFVGLPTALAFPCFVIGLLASPLCGAALTFFAAAKKAKQRKRLNPPAHKRVPRTAAVVVHLESVFSHIRRE
jgi:hypothetical protein